MTISSDTLKAYYTGLVEGFTADHQKIFASDFRFHGPNLKDADSQTLINSYNENIIKNGKPSIQSTDSSRFVNKDTDTACKVYDFIYNGKTVKIADYLTFNNEGQLKSVVTIFNPQDFQ